MICYRQPVPLVIVWQTIKIFRINPYEIEKTKMQLQIEISLFEDFSVQLDDGDSFSNGWDVMTAYECEES